MAWYSYHRFSTSWITWIDRPSEKKWSKYKELTKNYRPDQTILLISYFVHSFFAREAFINQCLYIDIHICGLCNSVMQIWFAKPLSLNDRLAGSNGWHIGLIKLELGYAITLWLFWVFYLLKNQHSQTLIQPGQRDILKEEDFCDFLSKYSNPSFRCSDM